MEHEKNPPVSPLGAIFGGDTHYFEPCAPVQGKYDYNKSPTAFVRPLTSESDETEEKHLSEPEWSPGYLSRFPWLGVGALFTVLCCAVGAVITLVCSNGVSQSKWPEKLAPNVILSGLNSVGNICFSIAIGNGIAIAWWRKTLHGSTIQDLHRSWSFSSSFKDLLLAGKYFNVIALAALATKLTIIDSMLLQRATSATIATDQPVNVTDILGFANDTIPVTGQITGEFSVPAVLDTALSWDLNIWSNSGGLFPNTFAGCDGECFIHVPAAGFEIECDAPVSKSINYGKSAVSTYNALQNNTNATFPTYPLFSINFGVQFRTNDYSQLPPVGGGMPNMAWPDGRNWSFITMDVLSTKANDTQNTSSMSCPGTQVLHKCILRPAVINYPVTVRDYSGPHAISGISLGLNTSFYNDPNATVPAGYDPVAKQQAGFEVLRYNNVYEYHELGYNHDTRLGGILLGLRTYLTGSASLEVRNTAEGFVVSQNGFAPTFLNTAPGQYECDYEYTDPLDYLVQMTNQIMFSIGTDISGMDANNQYMASQYFSGTMYKDSIHYVTVFPFMYGAVASMLVCILCVLPTYWGYWQLGRKVTLGPFEIANAFRAPMLRNASAGNQPVDDLLKEIGQRQVKYGKIVAGEDAGRLGVAQPELVERVHPTAKLSKM